jgi:aryl-alcohol dehydrogenase-like predicted oxidoreductase
MIALGTVQFGLPYGIANKSGQIKAEKIKQILKIAKKAGIKTLDTAIDYGDSERAIGDTGVTGWDIVTKIPEIPSTRNNLELRKWVRYSIEESLVKLNVNSIYGVLLHRPLQLVNPDFKGVWEELRFLQNSGIIKKIGYSIYDHTELDILFQLYKPNLIQAPYNLFDRGIEKSGWLEKLNSQNIEVHTRSCFLQGLLLMKPALRPNKFKKWSHIWTLYDEWIDRNNITTLQACLNFALSNKQISKVIIGVDNVEQIEEIISAINTKQDIDFIDFNATDKNLINPASWNNL